MNSQLVSYINIKQFNYQLAEFNTAAYLTASKFDTTNFKDDTKRQLKKVFIQSNAHEIIYNRTVQNDQFLFNVMIKLTFRLAKKLFPRTRKKNSIGL